MGLGLGIHFTEDVGPQLEAAGSGALDVAPAAEQKMRSTRMSIAKRAPGGSDSPQRPRTPEQEGDDQDALNAALQQLAAHMPDKNGRTSIVSGAPAAAAASGADGDGGGGGGGGGSGSGG